MKTDGGHDLHNIFYFARLNVNALIKKQIDA